MVTSTVVEPGQATDKAQVETKDLTAPGAGLDAGKEGAETKPEKLYRQSEVDALLGRAGQRLQVKLEAVIAERDQFKTQVETLTSEITEAKEAIVSLNTEIEAMSESDPDKSMLVKLRKQKESELRDLKTERAKVEESVKKVTQWERDQLVYRVADEYVTASGEKVNLDAFKTAADKFKLSGEEELEDLAETMGLSRKTETKESDTPPLTLYSGKTSGGRKDLNSLTTRELGDLMYQKK